MFVRKLQLLSGGAALALLLAGCTTGGSQPSAPTPSAATTKSAPSASASGLVAALPETASVIAALGAGWSLDPKASPSQQPVQATAAPSDPAEATGCAASTTFLSSPAGESEAATEGFVHGDESQQVTVTRFDSTEQATAVMKVAAEAARSCAGKNADGDPVTAETDPATASVGLSIAAADGTSFMGYAARGSLAITVAAEGDHGSTTVVPNAQKLLALAVESVGRAG